MAHDAVFVPDGAGVYVSFVREAGIEHVAVVAPQGRYVVDGVYHIQTSSTLTDPPGGMDPPLQQRVDQLI